MSIYFREEVSTQIDFKVKVTVIVSYTRGHNYLVLDRRHSPFPGTTAVLYRISLDRDLHLRLVPLGMRDQEVGIGVCNVILLFLYKPRTIQ